MNADDETNVTDIELLPDGRIHVFGTSFEVLDVLDEMQGGRDAAVKLRLRSYQDRSQQQPPSIQRKANHG